MKHVSLQLPASQLDWLDGLRAGAPCTRSELVRLILADWRKARGVLRPVAASAGGGMASVPVPLRSGVRARLKVVQEWRDARAAGRRRGRAINDVTADFLARLARRGLSLSRATLFNWDRRYRTKGAAGLIDARGRLPLSMQAGAESTPQRRHRQAV